MSAYVVNPAHIDVLIDATKQFRLHGKILRWRKYADGEPFASTTLSEVTADELGQMLLRQNERSVASLYRENEDDSSLHYRYRATGRIFTASQILMVLRGYEYQACETRDWERTEAHDFCRALMEFVVRTAVPEGSADEWLWTDHRLGRIVA